VVTLFNASEIEYSRCWTEPITISVVVAPILFFNSGYDFFVLIYCYSPWKTMACCFPCHQPLCLRALILFGTTLWCYPYWYLRFPMDWWIRKLYFGYRLEILPKLLRLRCSLMNSAGKSPCRYIYVQRFFYLFDYVQRSARCISIIFC
jgi:hypothetical protein